MKARSAAPRRSRLSLQQCACDDVPFRRQRFAWHRTLRLPVPIARIGEVAFHAVQIGMHPGAILAGLVHDDLVRLVPLVLARPPQRRERRREAGRLCLGERALELGQIHRTTAAKMIESYHHHRSGANRPAACSTTWPSENNVSSSKGRPMSWSPSGRPSADRPPGTEMPGSPAMFTVTVNTSLRYISTGSAAPFSPMPNAAEGVAGVRTASTPAAKTLSKSRLISVRTFCARR